MRCASVRGEVRKAFAISSVVNPHTSRKVSATCASGARDGWQQVNIRRSRSSSRLSSSSDDSAELDCASRYRTSSSCDASNLARRRRVSMALNRAVEINHGRGLPGTPLLGHTLSAAAKASCIASSARSKSPSKRIRVARIRPESTRYSESSNSRICSVEGSDITTTLANQVSRINLANGGSARMGCSRVTSNPEIEPRNLDPARAPSVAFSRKR